jgi:hypothetical protein
MSVEFPEQSFSHYHFSNGDVPNNKSELNKKIAQQIKQTHFSIGDPKQPQAKETSNGSTY